MMHLPQLKQPRFGHKVVSLRTWEQIDWRTLRDGIEDERRQGIGWKSVPWQYEPGRHRSFILCSDDGSLYAVFVRKVYRL